MSFSAGAPVDALLSRAQQLFHLQRTVRLWRLPDDVAPGPAACVFADALKDGTAELVDPPDAHASLAEAMLDEQLVRLAVEHQDPLGNWLVDADQLAAARGLVAPAAPALLALESSKKPGLFASASGGFFGALEKSNALTPRYKNGKDKATSPAPNGNHSFLNSISGALTGKKPGPRGGQRGLTGLTNLGK